MTLAPMELPSHKLEIHSVSITYKAMRLVIAE
jgi:hypothetical protein